MRQLRFNLFKFFVVILGVFVLLQPAEARDPLPSWKSGSSKTAILNFVKRVTTPGPNFVPKEERIAVFDNDGTLWTEKPVYTQVFFLLDQVQTKMKSHPEWKNVSLFQALQNQDLKALAEIDRKALLKLVAEANSGMSVEEYGQSVKAWLAKAKHPRFKRPFTELIYQPMLELLKYLQSKGFQTFIVSGGGIEFMRPWTQQVYGIPPDQVVGSSIELKLEERGGKPVLIRQPKIHFIDDGPGKPVGIQRYIGERPIMAFGNSDGDLQMLQWTAAGSKASLIGLVHHDDGLREYAYDRDSKVGKLDQALKEAKAKKWTVISMKEDWNQIFPSP